MSLNRYEFEILTYIEQGGQRAYPVRETADALCLSGTAIMRGLEALGTAGFIMVDKDGCLSITDEGLEALEPYRVRRAIVLAAGFGSRMMPATAERPKPMVTVNGVRIIDTLLDALEAAGIRDVTIIGGYRFDRLSELLGKYPFLQLRENVDYDTTNNISSAMLALDLLQGGCYLCEADLYISNPGIITKYQYASNILGSYSMETDDWCFRMADGCVSDYRKGGTYCYNYYGISYWSAEDCDRLREDFRSVFEGPEGRDYFWEFIPFVLKKDRYRVEIRPCRKQDIVEIDNYYELAQLDPGYGEGEDHEML
jgi:CTP:phosphocholine cytidylyltransferase-like protein